MLEWFVEDVLKTVLPRAVAAFVALGIAHSDLLHKWGLTVDWGTFGGKLDAALVLFVGLLAAHHTEKAVKGAPS